MAENQDKPSRVSGAIIGTGKVLGAIGATSLTGGYGLIKTGLTAVPLFTAGLAVKGVSLFLPRILKQPLERFSSDAFKESEKIALDSLKIASAPLRWALGKSEEANKTNAPNTITTNSSTRDISQAQGQQNPASVNINTAAKDVVKDTASVSQSVKPTIVSHNSTPSEVSQKLGGQESQQKSNTTGSNVPTGFFINLKRGFVHLFHSKKYNEAADQINKGAKDKVLFQLDQKYKSEDAERKKSQTEKGTYENMGKGALKMGYAITFGAIKLPFDIIRSVPRAAQALGTGAIATAASALKILPMPKQLNQKLENFSGRQFQLASARFSKASEIALREPRRFGDGVSNLFSGQDNNPLQEGRLRLTERKFEKADALSGVKAPSQKFVAELYKQKVEDNYAIINAEKTKQRYIPNNKQAEIREALVNTKAGRAITSFQNRNTTFEKQKSTSSQSSMNI